MRRLRRNDGLTEINRRRGEADRRSEITLTNFRGIELKDFPATIARLALIIAEYQCDVLHRGQREATRDFLPLDSKNWITCGNALRLDWLSICPPTGAGVKMRGDDLFSLHSPSGVSFEVKIACIRALDKDFLPQAAPAVAQTAGSGRIRPRSRCFLAQGRRFSAQRTDLSSRFRSV